MMAFMAAAASSSVTLCFLLWVGFLEVAWTGSIAKSSQVDSIAQPQELQIYNIEMKLQPSL